MARTLAPGALTRTDSVAWATEARTALPHRCYASDVSTSGRTPSRPFLIALPYPSCSPSHHFWPSLGRSCTLRLSAL
ncbi:hypothetical protein K523DRAFT_323756 [Schizophyllum commune Tattone D]|nr:hypothetical protein K523DRAFT_323756 [Schizophyllum commune Tattone D]